MYISLTSCQKCIPGRRTSPILSQTPRIGSSDHRPQYQLTRVRTEQSTDVTVSQTIRADTRGRHGLVPLLCDLLPDLLVKSGELTMEIKTPRSNPAHCLKSSPKLSIAEQKLRNQFRKWKTGESPCLNLILFALPILRLYLTIKMIEDNKTTFT